MISGLTDSVLVTFIVFCRIGACLMLVPGYSSINVPAQVRLFVALVTTFALTPQNQTPRFVKAYSQLRATVTAAVQQYIAFLFVENASRSAGASPSSSSSPRRLRGSSSSSS